MRDYQPVVNARPAVRKDGRTYPDKRRIVQAHNGMRLVVSGKAVRRWKDYASRACR